MRTNDLIRITIRNPERFWFAIQTELPSLVDPDIQDHQGGRYRHADRDVIRWDCVGRAVVDLGRQLSSQHFAQSEDGLQLTTDDKFSLSPEELGIVVSWFSNGEAPCADPWHVEVSNGRHRLWGVWSSIPEAELPILSDLLLYEDSAEDMGEEFGQGLCISSKIGLLKVAENAPVRARSTAYFAHLLAKSKLAPDTAEARDRIAFEMRLGGFPAEYLLRVEPVPIQSAVTRPVGMKAMWLKLLGRS